MAYIIVKKYNHKSGINRALGEHVKNGAHYRDLMKRKGMVSMDEGNRLADEHARKISEPYKLTSETTNFIREVVSTSKDGKVTLGDRAVNKMKSIGVPTEMSDHAPEYIKNASFKGYKVK